MGVFLSVDNMNLSQKLNVYSNLAYLGSGLVGMFIGGGALGLPFLLSTTFLTIGSWYYHKDIGTEYEHISRLFDEVGMYAVFSTLMFQSLGVTEIMVPLLSWVFLAWAAPFIHSFVTLGILSVIIVVGMLYNFLFTEVIVAVSIFLVGFGIRHWSNKQDGHLHDNHWGHAIWHIISSVLIGYLFMVNG